MEQMDAEVVGLRRGYQELLTRVNDMERNWTQRLDELSRGYVKFQGDPGQGREREISKSKAIMSMKARCLCGRRRLCSYGSDGGLATVY